ncbi:MAG: methyltransferase domain-containing protein [Lachnospiraceae bacterium]|nr:methyltransferase domain-containing protein [Lachnospiraceae bacterium]
MLTWSKYFQNPVFMELTRKYLIPEELCPTILAHAGVGENTSVLDVASGTGYFSRLLKKHEPSARVTGLEYDGTFVEFARDKAREEQLDITFVQGDALALPFEDETFDAVTSHTFLTSAADPRKALQEMIRVCRRGGVVSSITTMSALPSAFHGGFYRKECSWAQPLADLSRKMNKMLGQINPISNYVNDLPLAKLPHLFAMSGLKEIGAYPIGKLFSLSNALIPYEERMEYLDQMIEADRLKLEAYLELEGVTELFSREDAERYLELLDEKRAYYRSHPDENQIWEWNGGANVQVFGKKL